ncbi:MAG: hypothetical protein KZQ64_12745 [gamma proteobacterium symbiont of Bathyaustriella thionipta]|nr:hypothetical protein [gamma proteobacterium symbiont of Bathyaustriella thionipta]MCU7949792.1 hypothetical protein [gamma proteobacterium symbiont of Bathyaustriella thionipta]MCU7954239.1 hypothetical protein [gamma proteobacterium symbiont of Bathyaustriella thionipta]MCU7956386.1 hypothetical protein [gamma proteobacterium symbiont of Bathyaustriella thionipta]MCU7968520.1 hypothetical protein [gamma proteobacterium symbiont of Bathyaustriella thionipta]
MDTLTVIISGVVILLIFDAFLIYYVRKKRKGSFKLVIEKGVITENQGNIPSEFLYDIQQLARINKPDSLIINGSGLTTNDPKLEFLGVIDPQLQIKMEQSLVLSLQ